jgi:hypothetical protein
MKTWAPLWCGIVDSSVWDEPDHVVKVFLTMLALKDADHIVRLSAYQLHVRSRKTEQEVLDALKVLSEPDRKRAEPQPFEGRRIELVEEGWLVLNGQYYRDMVSLEMKRAKNRRAQKTFRDKGKSSANQPQAAERLAVRGLADGILNDNFETIDAPDATKQPESETKVPNHATAGDSGLKVTRAFEE